MLKYVHQFTTTYINIWTPVPFELVPVHTFINMNRYHVLNVFNINIGFGDVEHIMKNQTSEGRPVLIKALFE